MVKFMLLDSDFWGNTPEVREYELRPDVINGFGELCSLALARLVSIASGDSVQTRLSSAVHDIAKRRVFASMQVSGEMETAVIHFRVRRDDRADNGSFVAYCLYACQQEWGGHASSIYEVRDGWLECSVALKTATARSIVEYLITATMDTWYG